MGAEKHGRILCGHVFLDELAKTFAVFIFHVHKFDAVAVRADVADDGREVNLAQARSNFELDGITRAEAVG